MVKHTQPIRQQQPTNYLKVFDHFVGLALKELTFLHKKLMYRMLYIVILTIYIECYIN